MEITPRPFGEVLGDAVNALGRTWRPLFSTALIAFIPVGIITLVVFKVSGAAEVFAAIIEDPGYLERLDDNQLAPLATPLLWASGVTLILQIVASIFVYLASHRAMAAHLNGELISGREARRWALTRLRVGVGAGFIAIITVVLIIILGFVGWLVPYTMVGTPNSTSLIIATLLFLALVGPGVWLGVSFSMVTSVVALEDRGVFTCLRRSIRLVRGRWWATLGYLVLVGVLGSVAIQLIQIVGVPMAAVTGAETSMLALGVVGIIAQGIIVAAIGGMYTLWYVDLRARKEPLLSGDLL
ncbi:MAG TPA: hypothetical protein EYP73_05025 [Acidimicrobiia bacterium]|nr:hypothetical protein [Acidimicrobiia bacterium]